jgi:hypothetical protein
VNTPNWLIELNPQEQLFLEAPAMVVLCAKPVATLKQSVTKSNVYFPGIVLRG